MRKSKRILKRLFTILVLACVVNGCDSGSEVKKPLASGVEMEHSDGHELAEGESDGHVHQEKDSGKDEPADYAAAIVKLDALTKTICAAFQRNAPEDAHADLHTVGHLLNSLADLAKKDKPLEEEAAKTLTPEVDAMLDAFTELDGVLHGGAEVDSKAIEEKLTKSLDVLRSIQ